MSDPGPVVIRIPFYTINIPNQAAISVKYPHTYVFTNEKVKKLGSLIFYLSGVKV